MGKKIEKMIPMKGRKSSTVNEFYILPYYMFSVTAAQDNASPKIPDHLIECYSNQSIYHRENRLPMTLRTLLDLLRKIEASPSGSNMNAREIAASLQY